MKNEKKKLELNKESFEVLTAAEIETVNGGKVKSDTTCASGDVQNCSTTCDVTCTDSECVCNY